MRVLGNVALNPGFFATYAAVQALVLLLLVRLIDPFTRQSLRALALFALWGATGAALIALTANETVASLLSGDSRVVFGDAVSAPLVEEAAKGIALVLAVLISYRFGGAVSGWRFAGITAGLAAGAAVGIGFAFTEDFFYFIGRSESEGIQAGADLFAGRRDFLGPTSLHHPLFTATLGAGIGAAVWSRTWRGRVLWPLLGLAGAIAAHAINNGLVELLLVREHGLEAARNWIDGLPVSAAVDSTADAANRILLVLDFVYVGLFFAVVLFLQQRERRAGYAALATDVEDRLIDEEDRRTVCAFGGRTARILRLLRAGERERAQRERRYLDEVASLAAGRLLLERGRIGPPALGELRRRLIAAQGVVRAPGRVAVAELEMVGRDRELGELERLLASDTRLITVTGPGGTGKTRLAQEVATRVGPRFAHGAYFVDLSMLRDPSEVVPAIARTLDVALPSGEEGAPWLGELLRDRELLLVLDNFEQLMAGAMLIGRLLSAAPRLSVLITTRIVLDLPGETEYPLRPLAGAGADGAASPAAHLFVDRARRAGGSVADGDLPSIEEICERVDRLPLAIELIAARTRTLPVSALSVRLAELPELASRTSAAAPDRQGSLRGAIAWSEDLLDDRARHLFGAIAVPPAGCRLESVRAAWGPEELDRSITTLVQASLLRTEADPDGEPRYRMLETIRAYGMRTQGARETLAKGGLVRYCEATVAQVGGHSEDLAARLLDLERPNLIGALGVLREGEDRDGVLSLLTETQLLWERSDPTTARELLDWAYTPGGVAPHGRPAAAGRRLQGRLALLQGDYEMARVAFERTLDEMPAGREAERFDALWNIAWVLMFTGLLEEAKAVLQEARAKSEGLDRRRGAMALASLGRVTAELGDHDAGRELLERARVIREELGDVRGAISAMSGLARISLLAGDPGGAVDLSLAALDRATEAGDTLRQAEALYPVVSGLVASGRAPEAVTRSMQRLMACRELGDRLGIAEILDACALLTDASGAPRFIAAADGLRKSNGAKRWPSDQALIDARAERSGDIGELSLAEAVRLAEDELTRLGDPARS